MWFILIKNLVICSVPSTTTADCNLFNSHRNKKLMGGNYNVQVHFKNASASNPEGVVLCNTFKWDILLFILIENDFVCMPSTTADGNLFNNHRYKKVVGGNTNVLVYYVDASAPDSEGVILCNTFKWVILLCVHIHFKSLKCMLCMSLRYEILVGLQD